MRTSINYTTFASPKVAAEILAAMRKGLETGDSTRLVNRKGEPWLLVTISKDDIGYHFAFIDTNGDDQRHNVHRAAIKVWSDKDGNSFWRMYAESFDLTEHPAVAKARKELHAYMLNDAASQASMNGATHKVITYGGAVIGYGGYQRDWLGRKRLYLVTDETGKAYVKARKLTPEASLMVARLEAL